MLYIVIISAAVFILSMMDTTKSLLNLLRFSPYYILRGQVWRLVTWAFLPLNDNILFTALMLYFYYFIGSTLEQQWGTPKFTIYYVFGLILNLIYGFVIYGFVYSYTYVIGPYINIVPNYINLSMFFAFATLYPDNRIMLFFVIPIKIKWMALVNALFFAYSIISALVSGNVVLALLPLVALLNFFIICGSDIANHLRRLRIKASPRAINFKQAAKKAKRENDAKQYRHKCAVCGKTDSDYPDLDFRYCSRCNGYHCYCIEHINNHIHFQ